MISRLSSILGLGVVVAIMAISMFAPVNGQMTFDEPARPDPNTGMNTGSATTTSETEETIRDGRNNCSLDRNNN